MKKELLAIYGCSATGILIVRVSLHSGDLLPLLWNVAPYLLVLLLSVVVGEKVVVLCGVAVMLLVDAWFYLGVALEIGSPLMVLVSLLISFKVFTVLPGGMGLGYVAMRMYNKKGREKETD